MRLPSLRASADLAVDLGTANTVVFRRGEGVVLFEPSVVAIDERTGRVHAVGDEARRMFGRTPATITASRPLRHGVISDFETTEQMLRHFIRRVSGGRPRADVVVCVPSGLTQVERSAVVDATVGADCEPEPSAEPRAHTAVARAGPRVRCGHSQPSR